MIVCSISFPEYSGLRCLMMPYIQGDPESVPHEYRRRYASIIESVCVEPGRIGYLTIDESVVESGAPHRGSRAKHGRAIHTEAGRLPGSKFVWGGSDSVLLDPEVAILIANNVDNSCAIWNASHENTSEDGDIGLDSAMYPYDDAVFVKSGDVHRLGVLTPHESLPVWERTRRQFLRIVGEGVRGREPYFTTNPIVDSQ